MRASTAWRTAATYLQALPLQTLGETWSCTGMLGTCQLATPCRRRCRRHRLRRLIFCIGAIKRRTQRNVDGVNVVKGNMSCSHANHRTRRNFEGVSVVNGNVSRSRTNHRTAHLLLLQLTFMLDHTQLSNGTTGGVCSCSKIRTAKLMCAQLLAVLSLLPFLFLHIGARPTRLHISELSLRCARADRDHSCTGTSLAEPWPVIHVSHL
mmetsp:Transcript_29755/g.58453  ORF Transcript_29755/g.58453 Transcript_29755/m.58453 type:complete len:208 (+) Transcript_29755:47-670(+)